MRIQDNFQDDNWGGGQKLENWFDDFYDRFLWTNIALEIYVIYYKRYTNCA